MKFNLLRALLEHTIAGAMTGGHVMKEVFVGSVACKTFIISMRKVTRDR
jgi:hypothetical protein